ncbi:MAG: hypothetical protein QM706_12830 [Nitrospira sp.]
MRLKQSDYNYMVMKVERRDEATYAPVNDHLVDAFMWNGFAITAVNGMSLIDTAELDAFYQYATASVVHHGQNMDYADRE